jgi:NADH dehydrogenase (ubiquinone) Fe-S protein 1
MLRAINKTSVARYTPTLLKTGGNLFIPFVLILSRVTNQPCFIAARAFTASTHVKEEVEVFIDGKSVMIEQGAALIQACEKAGADVSVVV